MAIKYRLRTDGGDGTEVMLKVCPDVKYLMALKCIRSNLSDNEGENDCHDMEQ